MGTTMATKGTADMMTVMGATMDTEAMMDTVMVTVMVIRTTMGDTIITRQINTRRNLTSTRKSLTNTLSTPIRSHKSPIRGHNIQTKVEKRILIGMDITRDTKTRDTLKVTDTKVTDTDPTMATDPMMAMIMATEVMTRVMADTTKVVMEDTDHHTIGESGPKNRLKALKTPKTTKKIPSKHIHH